MNPQILRKTQIALVLIDQAMADGVSVKAWTFDELYGRDCKFLDGLDERKQAFVGEVPPNFRMWTRKPKVLRKPPRNRKGRPKKYPRLTARDAKANKVENLAKYSPGLSSQTPQRYRVRDSQKGPEVWEVRWHVCYRKTHDGRIVSSQCTLIVAKNVRTGEVKYFVSNRVPGLNGWTLRDLLRIAFGRWTVEACFANTKQSLPESHIINAATPTQAVATGNGDWPTTATWESTPAKSKASTQNHRETNYSSHEVALAR